ncbi:MAG TPA: PIG-L family deacetylase, partial [Gemmatimonadaceae bacterium]|nr:PIG-L family deacetylase [Gemmatimonadaceae bacterium]
DANDANEKNDTNGATRRQTDGDTATVNAARRASAESHEGRPHLIVVEDDPELARTLVDWLEQGRYRTTLFPSGGAAIAQLALLQFDGVICDADVSDAKGVEMLRTSKSVRPLVPVMIITSDRSNQIASEAVRNHADEMLLKPFDHDVLLRRLQDMIVTGRAARRAGPRTVLAISAHPDDAEIGVGGTLMGHIATGDRVIHLVLTDGEGGGAREDRIAEVEAAAASMGVVLRRASLPDGCLADTMETVAAVEEIIREYSPSLMYIHSEHDTHQDHRTAHHVAMVAARNVPFVYAYQAPSSTVDFRPARFIDIARQLDRKIDVLRLFRSQAPIRAYLADDLIRATARYWGRFAGHSVVEPLEVIRQLSQ